MRISADDPYQEMPRQMKINIDRCTQVRRSMSRHQTRHFGFSKLKNQSQAKLPKCSDEFLTQQNIYCLVFLTAEEQSFCQTQFCYKFHLGEKITCDWNSLFLFLFIYSMSFYLSIDMNCFAMSEQFNCQIQGSDRFVGLAPNYRSALL